MDWNLILISLITLLGIVAPYIYTKLKELEWAKKYGLNDLFITIVKWGVAEAEAYKIKLVKAGKDKPTGEELLVRAKENIKEMSKSYDIPVKPDDIIVSAIEAELKK